MPVDLSSRKGAEACSEELLDCTHGQLDVLILNAGISNHADFLRSDLDAIEYELRLNYLSPMVFCGGACRIWSLSQMEVRSCVGSLTSLMPFPGEASYAASKAALFGLLRSLQVELREQPVKLTTVLPGYTATEMTENHRSFLPAMSPDRVGASIAKAVEERPNLVIRGSQPNRCSLFRTFPTL